MAIGVIPDFQKRGIEAAMLLDQANRLRSNNSGYKDMVVTWVGDYNPRWQQSLDKIGFQRVSKMATYRKLFDPNKTFERSPIIMN